MSDWFSLDFLMYYENLFNFATSNFTKTNNMKKILMFSMLLFSLHAFAGVGMSIGQDEDSEDIVLKEGNSDNRDRHPRTSVPIVCKYTNGMVQLSMFGEVGDFTLTVTNQMTGKYWSVENSLVLQTSIANGIYWVQIVTEDGTLYYGTYTL